MTVRALILWLIGVALVGWVAAQTFHIVAQDRIAIVTRFGKRIATITRPGLYMKAPLIDAVVSYDKHLLSLQPPLDEIILGDQKRVEVTTISRFRIVDALQFYQSVGTEDQARINLAQIVSSEVRKDLGKASLPSLLTAERDRISDQIRNEVAEQAKELGVEVIDVRILRAELPVETSQAIYDRMSSERVREAKELRAQGFEVAQQIGPRPTGRRRSCCPIRCATARRSAASPTRSPTRSRLPPSAATRNSTISIAPCRSTARP